ncbi:MAG: methyltransferase domain-containing protein [Verrucomicrobiota bacterium]
MNVINSGRTKELENEVQRLRAELTKVKDTRDKYRAERDADREERDKLRAAALFARPPRGRFASRLKGEGIEIGALDKPLPVPEGVKVRYVDRRSREETMKGYTGKRDDVSKFVHNEFVCNGEKLEVIDDETQDFVIANHMLEHCMNPIGTVKNFLRVTKPGGLLFITLPDKRYSFDYKRPITPWEHILNDYETDIEVEPIETYEDWNQYVNPNAKPESKFKNQSNIHFHAWTMNEIVEMFSRMQSDLGFPIHLESALQAGNEVICLLRKEEFKQEHYDHPGAV